MAALCCACSMQAAEWHVDNAKGDDTAGDGSQAKPFKSIARGLKSLKGGDTLHLVPNKDFPYQETIDSHPDGNWAGTAEKPTVIDGHGSVLSMLLHQRADKWKSEGGGVFSRPLRNNAWVMDQQGHWSGFPIVFLDGKPAEFRKNREALEPLTYFLYKDYPKKQGEMRNELHNTLYIRLPDGKTPDDVKVESVDSATNVHVSRSYVTVRNLVSMYSGGDGFATTRAKGIVFENVRGCFNMDQGMSHHGAEVTVINSRFDNNAGCGVVDVYPECRTKYLGCVIEDDVFRGGVEFHSGEFEMEDCVIRNNTGKALSVNKDAKVKLRNCLFISKDAEFQGIAVGGGNLEMTACTVFNAKDGIAGWSLTPQNRIEVRNCAFVANKTNYSWHGPKDGERPKMLFESNFLTPAPVIFFGKTYKPEQWDEYRKDSGLDAHSLMKQYDGPLPPNMPPIEVEGGIAGAETK